MKPAFPLISRPQLQSEFASGDWQRGVTVFNKNKVREVIQKPAEMSEMGRRVFQYQAWVKGSYGETYHTRVTLIEPEGENTHLYQVDGVCDCPVGHQCKHAVAVCLFILRERDLADSTSALRDSAVQPNQKGASVSDPEQGMDSVAFQCLLNEIEHFAGARGSSDRRDDWYHFHLFDSTDRPYSQPLEIAVGTDLTLMRHHYTVRGNLAKPKPMQLQTYFNRFITPGYTEDHKIARLMRACGRSNGPVSEVHFTGPAGFTLLKRLVQGGHAHFKQHPDTLVWTDAPFDMPLQYDADPSNDDLYRVSLPFDRTSQFLVLCEPPVVIDLETQVAQPVRSPLFGQGLYRLLEMPPLSQHQLNALIETLGRQSRATASETPSQAKPDLLPELVGVEHREVRTPPVPVLIMTKPLPDPVFDLFFAYGDYRVAATMPQAVIQERIDQVQLTLHRDLAKENAAMARLAPVLEKLSLSTDPGHSEEFLFVLPEMSVDTQAGLQRFLDLQALCEQLRDEGWLFEGFDQAWYDRVTPDEIQVQTEEGAGWFDLSFQLQLGDRALSMTPILEYLLQAYDSVDEIPETVLIPMQDQEVLQLPKDEIAPIYDTLSQLYEGGDLEKTLRVAPFNAHLVAGLSDVSMQWLGDRKLMQLADKLKHFERIEPVAPASGLKAELRPYQAFGLSWLQFLYEHGFNGVLADDMGLGKTLQTLSWLQRLKEAGELSEPALLVLPTSLIANWKQEATRFTPDLNLLTLHGSDRAMRFDQVAHSDLVLTTYPLLPRDQAVFKAHAFKVIILDEAQKIKNPRTQLYAALVQLKAQHRLCLTGTPVENHLGELWSLFNFLMPGFLGNQPFFKKHYQKPIELEGDRALQERLTNKVAPFLLRRTKHQVAQELPDKTEIIKTVEFEPAQARLYETIRVAMEDKVRQTVAQKGMAKSQITLLDALLKLRQVCCDPGLVKIEAAKKVKHSAKLALLLDLLGDLLEADHRIIIFSQFTSMLKIIEGELKKMDVAYSLLTGQTKKREETITRFKQGDSQVFLISLKAGGVGLNLTEADTVIHYDPWWNPAVENQATDRAHRIGQDKEVFVYKLVVANSIEEKILQLQSKKQALQDRVYRKDQTDEKGAMQLASVELLDLLKPDH